MADKQRTGPPPKKDDRRAANTTVHLEDKGDWNNLNNTTNKQTAKASSASKHLSVTALRSIFWEGR